MLIKTLVVGHLDTNCYVVTDENTLECAVIDPGAESNTILDYLEDNHLKCVAVMLTHAHFDHTGALAAVLEETGARCYVSARKVGTSVSGYDAGFKAPGGGVPLRRGGRGARGLAHLPRDGDPGAHAGGVTLICGDALFTGDTLFRLSCGRTDLPGGDMKEELRSLKRLGELPGDYEVYPGHAEEQPPLH